MVRSKYTFEKSKKEKAKRLKQIEKSAQRMMTKKAKATSEPEAAETESVVDDQKITAE